MLKLINREDKLKINDVVELCYNLIKYYGLEEYCGIQFEVGRDYFSFSNLERMMYLPNTSLINSERLQNKIIYRLEMAGVTNILAKKNNTTDKIFILYAILHEMEHANQQKKIIEKYKENDKIYTQNLISSIYNMNFLSLINTYHDNAYHEYDANINAILKINELNKIMPLKDIHEFNQYGAFLILKSSKNKQGFYESPLSQNNKLTMRDCEQTIRHLNLKKKLSNELIDMQEIFRKPYLYSINGLKQHNLKNDLKSRLLRGDNLTMDELELLTKIATATIKTDDLLGILEKTNNKEFTSDDNYSLYDSPKNR